MHLWSLKKAFPWKMWKQVINVFYSSLYNAFFAIFGYTEGALPVTTI